MIDKLRDLVDENGIYNWGSVSVGNRTSAIDMIGYGSALIQYSISNIGTNIVAGIEISNDAVGWDNADVNDEWETKTANGTFTFSYSGSAKYMRFYWVSASGGSPQITDIIIFGGQR
jgi:hypothetical protein